IGDTCAVCACKIAKLAVAQQQWLVDVLPSAAAFGVGLRTRTAAHVGASRFSRRRGPRTDPALVRFSGGDVGPGTADPIALLYQHVATAFPGRGRVLA